MSKLTLEKLLTKTDDEMLLSIQEELLSGIVPATGAAHGFVRRVNRMIDKGELCINPTTYRKVYLPTLAKAVQREMARRYCEAYSKGLIVIFSEDSCEHTALGLVNELKQDKVEEH